MSVGLRETGPRPSLVNNIFSLGLVIIFYLLFELRVKATLPGGGTLDRHFQVRLFFDGASSFSDNDGYLEFDIAGWDGTFQNIFFLENLKS